MTYRFFIFDIQTVWKQTFDDAELTLAQVMYWTTVGSNRLAQQHAQKKNQNETGKFLAIFSPVTVQLDTKLNDRKFIDLPAKMLDLKDNRGIEYITYNEESCNCCDGPSFAQTEFESTTASKAKRLYFSKYEKPEPSRPYYYRVGERFYFLGIECIDVTDVEVGLLVAQDPEKICDLDDEIPLPEHLIQILRAEVLNMGRLILLIPKDSVNQGADLSQQANQGGDIPKVQPTVTNEEQ